MINFGTQFYIWLYFLLFISGFFIVMWIMFALLASALRKFFNAIIGLLNMNI